MTSTKQKSDCLCAMQSLVEDGRAALAAGFSSRSEADIAVAEMRRLEQVTFESTELHVDFHMQQIDGLPTLAWEKLYSPSVTELGRTGVTPRFIWMCSCVCNSPMDECACRHQLPQ